MVDQPSAEGIRESHPRRIFRVVSGNFLEMFDFTAYGIYSGMIGHAFFPTTSPYLSIMLVLATFGAGFLMRPLGAIVLGAYMDKHGARKGLFLTLSIMALGTLLIACVPGYATLGLLAPMLVLLGRLFQGFSAGVELGGVSVYLAEIAPADKRGFYVAWQSAGTQIAVLFSAGLGLCLNFLLTPRQMADWGWRVPFVIGCSIVPVLIGIRRKLKDSDDFLRRAAHITEDKIARSLASGWLLILGGMLAVSLNTTVFYLITAYTTVFGRQELGIPQSQGLLVTMLVGLSNFLWLPIMGIVADRIGRRPLLLATIILALISAYPLMLWLAASPSFARLLVTQLWFSFIFGSYTGALVVWLTEIVPQEARTSSFSLIWSLSTAVFGGFTPAISTWLIHVSGSKAAPGLWISASASLALVAVFLLTRVPRRRAEEPGKATDLPEPEPTT